LPHENAWGPWIFFGVIFFCLNRMALEEEILLPMGRVNLVFGKVGWEKFWDKIFFFMGAIIFDLFRQQS
jgi:hypothetical protein